MTKLSTQTRNYRVVAITMDESILTLTKQAALENDASVSGLVNLALERLLKGKKSESVARFLQRSGLGKRRR